VERRNWPQAVGDENLALRSAAHIAVSVPHPTGGAARDPRVLLNETAHRLDGHPLTDFDQRRTYDTYDGQNRAAGPDWYALTFSDPVLVNCLEMTMGFAYRNGGWWTSLAVEAQDGDGHWRPVEHLGITPPYQFEDSRGERPYQTYALTFDAVTARGVRLIGQPGGLDQFTSLARIALYHRDLSRWRPAPYLDATPVPELFRLISPQVVWDLSASLSKLTGLTINLPLMEFYLDADRYQQCWQAMRRTYQGEPELWFLIGETIGWDIWNTIDSEDDPGGAREPHVRLSFHDSLAHAVAPVVVGGRVLGELISHAVIVRDRLDWSWHRQFARECRIPWATYRAAVRRSPQLTMEQLDGVATLMGLIANTIATLVYRLDRAHQDLERRSEGHKQIVRQAIDFMQEHLEEAIGVADIARAVALSPHYFSDLFAEQTGQSPSEFLINLRIERAKEYLTHTRMSPTEVSLVLGYSSSYFWRLFKRRTGSTPARYARRAALAHRPKGASL
jgi:AraC-like DNA-binding protein